MGVVSSDMGLVGIMGITGCNDLGDDGIMKHAPAATATGCSATYPQFLSYVADQGTTLRLTVWRKDDTRPDL